MYDSRLFIFSNSDSSELYDGSTFTAEFKDGTFMVGRLDKIEADYDYVNESYVACHSATGTLADGRAVSISSSGGMIRDDSVRYSEQERFDVIADEACLRDENYAAYRAHSSQRITDAERKRCEAAAKRGAAAMLDAVVEYRERSREAAIEDECLRLADQDAERKMDEARLDRYA